MSYHLLRPFLFLGDAERSHERALKALEFAQQHAWMRKVLRFFCQVHSDKLKRNLSGLAFRNPIGLAAGFDKNGRVVPAAEDLGFGFVEIGTVTPKPQAGNPKPRLWRFPRQHALVNAMGFPGEGAEAVARHLEKSRVVISIPVGVNLGKNRDTSLERAHEDLLAVLEILHPFGDFFVVNVSSPNTPGLRELQQAESLTRIANTLQNKLTLLGPKPLLVKIAPDLTPQDLEDIVRVAAAARLAGLVVANTTTNRSLVPRAAFLDRGGLSGKPLFPRTLELVTETRKLLGNEALLIASGGVFSGSDAVRLFAAGADLVEIYTALVYRGPRCAALISRELLRQLSNERLL
ncbi:MAG: quinone-dependent dihydroorotate dehydrogenase, partial [Calditrichaeota bacterium]|nr:quinone-dependent dihydroorotate dehydrogenase [Calditrichota bacterium]